MGSDSRPCANATAKLLKIWHSFPPQNIYHSMPSSSSLIGPLVSRRKALATINRCRQILTKQHTEGPPTPLLPFRQLTTKIFRRLRAFARIPLYLHVPSPLPCPQLSLGALAPSLENNESPLTAPPAALPLPGLCFGFTSPPLACLRLPPVPLPGLLLCAPPPRLLFAGLVQPALLKLGGRLPLRYVRSRRAAAAGLQVLCEISDCRIGAGGVS